MKIDKSTYVIWAILLPFLLWLHYDTYKGWITLLVLGICLLLILILGKFSKKIKQLKDKQFNIAFFVIVGVMVFLTQTIPDYLTEYFVYQNQRQTCGIVGQIHQSSWRGDTFLLEGHTNQFNILSHATLSVGDKVCVTYNPNEKWYGYAYVFKLDKQP